MSNKDNLNSDFQAVDVDEIMERIRRELSVQGEAGEASQVQKARQEAKAVHCRDFLEYDDEQFLKHAYRTLVHRLPEPEGLEFWLFKLREEGWSKIEILWSIHTSKEGRIHNTQLPGLKSRYILSVVKRFLVGIPVLGWFLRLGVNLLRLPRIHETVSHLERQRLAGTTHQANVSEIKADLMLLGQRVDELENIISVQNNSAGKHQKMK